jgi:Fe-S cluster assembly protein SufD
MNAQAVINLSAGERRLLEVLDAQGACGAPAAALIRAQGLPSRRVEGWRWSDLRAAIGADTQIQNAHDHAHDAAAQTDAPRDLSIITALASALSLDGERDGDDAAVLEFQGQANRVFSMKSGHQVVVERISAAAGLSAGSFAANVRGGTLTRIVIQDGAADAVVLNRAEVVVGPGGRYEQFTLSFGGDYARLETRVDLWDGGELVLNGAYMSAAGRHCDMTSEIIAHGPGRNAPPVGAKVDQNIRGVVRAGGQGVFQGKVLVAKPAQKTNARQNHQALLLEDGADVFAKPELQIFADDVQCAHGNAIGDLDEDALFYIRSRGVPEIEARAMLISAFLKQVIPDDLPEALHAEITGRMETWLTEKSQ